MNKRIAATNRIIEKTTSSEKFRKSIEEAVMKFRSSDWGNTSFEDKEQNVKALSRRNGLILGCYNTSYGMVHVFLDGKQERITIAFADEIV